MLTMFNLGGSVNYARTEPTRTIHGMDTAHAKGMWSLLTLLLS